MHFPEFHFLVHLSAKIKNMGHDERENMPHVGVHINRIGFRAPRKYMARTRFSHYVKATKYAISSQKPVPGNVHSNGPRDIRFGLRTVLLPYNSLKLDPQWIPTSSQLILGNFYYIHIALRSHYTVRPDLPEDGQNRPPP